MKKKKTIIQFFAVFCLSVFWSSHIVVAQNGFANYITISNGEFRDGNTVFQPLSINYIVDFACNLHDTLNKVYYIALHFNYSNSENTHRETEINDSIYTEWQWGYGEDGLQEMVTAKAKLEHDLFLMDSLGFNVVRLGTGIRWKKDTLRVPTGSYALYFELMDTLIAKCTRQNLRVIFVMTDDTNAYVHFDDYCVFLDSITHHFSNNKTVMAYVVFAEPGYKWRTTPNKNNDKLMISNWSRKWYYLIKKNAPNQLVTYGLDGIGNVLFWDPSALTYDFLSMHFYHNVSSPDTSANVVNSYFKWMNDNVQDVWTLGETGFSGTDNDSCINNAASQTGTEEDQYVYANSTMQRALECGCKGYTWWQYQDVNWVDCLQRYFGLRTFYPLQQLKSVHALFPTFKFRTEVNPCRRPGCYYNIPGYNYSNINGVVQDQNSNPIKDAYVAAWSNDYQSIYSTFTNSQGEYTIYTPQNTVLNEVRISYMGYNDLRFFTGNSTNFTSTLTHINYNKWKKNWTNGNYPIAGDIPVIGINDVFVVGNFYGDEAQELLLVNFSTSTATLYGFNTTHWEQIWTGTIGGWTITSVDKYFAGDFNGDGYDELLCLQNASNAWASIYHLNLQQSNSPWQYVWTNMGDGNIGNWSFSTNDAILPGHFNDSTYCSLMFIRRHGKQPTAMCQRLVSSSWVTIWTPSPVLGPTQIGSWDISSYDKYYVGDFSGDGIDELFCTQVTNGNSDNMTLLQYNSSWNTLWTNNGISEGVSIYPYRANLHVGNFDIDKADEILGAVVWATKFDLNTSNQWDWSWSTYDSGKLSDWSVNPYHKIFFLKTFKEVPDYLFVSYLNGPNFKSNAYSFDP